MSNKGESVFELHIRAGEELAGAAGADAAIDDGKSDPRGFLKRRIILHNNLLRPFVWKYARNISAHVKILDLRAFYLTAVTFP